MTWREPITVSNDEMAATRDVSRYLGQYIDRIVRGDIAKVVIMNRSQMVAVLVSVDEYERLQKRRPA